jgi:hypothetical protein
MPPDWIEWAMQKRGWGRLESEDEAECFCRYWQAKGGRDATKRDWRKTWQNWAANSRRQSGNGTSASGLSVLMVEVGRRYGSTAPT